MSPRSPERPKPGSQAGLREYTLALPLSSTLGMKL